MELHSRIYIILVASYFLFDQNCLTVLLYVIIPILCFRRYILLFYSWTIFTNAMELALNSVLSAICRVTANCIAFD